MSQTSVQRVLMVGAGLIGTSCALALRQAGVKVWLHDLNPEHLQQAVQRGAGRAGLPEGDAQAPDLIVVAIPTPAVPRQVVELQQRYPKVAITDVSSASEGVRRHGRHVGVDLAWFVSGHPMAGGECSGPSTARADLFSGRSWFIVDEPGLHPAAVQAVSELVALVGARPVRASAAQHDHAVALTSHVPHLLACVLAAAVEQADPLVVELAGPALKEMTRVAASSPAMWNGILQANAAAVVARLRPMIEQMHSVVSQLESVQIPETTQPLSAVDEVLSRGVAGRRRLL